MNEAPNILQVDLNRATPVYRQIADGLRTLLVGGDFKPGDQLPTVRQLAVDLGVHFNTVAEAYRLLADEGWLELRRHHGATVVLRPVQSPDAAEHRTYIQRLRELAAQAISNGVTPRMVAQELTALAEEIQKQERAHE